MKRKLSILLSLIVIATPSMSVFAEGQHIDEIVSSSMIPEAERWIGTPSNASPSDAEFPAGQHVDKIVSSSMIPEEERWAGTPSNASPSNAEFPAGMSYETFFADRFLGYAIAESLGKMRTDEVLLSDLENIENLNIGSYYIVSSLDGIEYLTNLHSLDINGSHISSLEPLRNMVDLNSIRLPLSEVSDLEPLSNLSNLEKLDLYWCNVSDITPLSKLTKLEYLNISTNKIKDVSSLSNLINLKQLRLSGNQINDIEPLSRLINLTYLTLDDNSITNIEPIINLIPNCFISINWQIIVLKPELLHIEKMGSVYTLMNPLKGVDDLNLSTSFYELSDNGYYVAPNFIWENMDENNLYVNFDLTNYNGGYFSYGGYITQPIEWEAPSIVTPGNTSHGTNSSSSSESTSNKDNTKAIGAWKQDDAGWWFQKTDGSYPKNEWLLNNGFWYWFNEAGYMATGWVLYNNSWYYLNLSGAMAKGWIEQNGNWYYLNTSGAMVVNTTTPDGYLVDANGVWIN